MSAVNRVPGRKTPSEPLARTDVTELESSTRMAAFRALQVMTTVSRAFSLIAEGMGDFAETPTEHKLIEWCYVINWLADQLDGECKNIESATGMKP